MNVFRLVKDVLIGRAHNLSDKKIFHNMSLIALLAWVGLGADGLSSSCYGPEAAFLALGAHTYLSLFVALASIVTIVVICASYSQIIELFPTGGGGYLVASKLLSPTAGVVSGAALLGDYVLTIALSVSSGADAIFSMLPEHYLRHKIGFSAGMVVFLTMLNLRGVKESIVLWVPVFFVFVGTYTFGIIWALTTHFGDLPQIMHGVTSDVRATYIDPQIGLIGMLAVMLRAYGLGAGTYTGIEAVSNAVNTLREPRVQTGKRTMVYMAASLSFVVGGLLLAYLFYHVTPTEGKTLNAVLFEKLTAEWPVNLSKAFVIAAMGSSAALLVIAAQTGFVGGPRVLANMAVDRWMPTRFATLSDRLVTQNGVVIMGIAALLIVVFTSAAVNIMVVLYSINVFVTFSLSQLGMVVHWWKDHGDEPRWKSKLAINAIGFTLTAVILVALSIMKFDEGGWVTIVVTGLLISFAFLIKRHYRHAREELARLDALMDVFSSLPPSQTPECDPKAKTAVVFVNGFNGLGVHTTLGIVRMFPGVFKNFIFAEIGVVDAGNFKGAEELGNLQTSIARETSRYADYMRAHGLHAEAVYAIGTEIVSTAAELAEEITEKFPNAVFFGGQLVFKHETYFTRLLHNFAVFVLQREFFKRGLPFFVLPIRV